MNLKQLGILIVAVIIIGGAGLMLHKRQQSSWTGGGAEVGKKLLGDDFPVNDIASISVQHGTNQLHLARKDDLWRVRERADYPANFSQISELLKKIARFENCANGGHRAVATGAHGPGARAGEQHGRRGGFQRSIEQAGSHAVARKNAHEKISCTVADGWRG